MLSLVSLSPRLSSSLLGPYFIPSAPRKILKGLFFQVWQMAGLPLRVTSGLLAFLPCKLLRWFQNLAPCGDLEAGQQTPKWDLRKENLCLCSSPKDLQHWACPEENRKVPEMAAGQAPHAGPSAGKHAGHWTGDKEARCGEVPIPILYLSLGKKELWCV